MIVLKNLAMLDDAIAVPLCGVAIKIARLI